MFFDRDDETRTQRTRREQFAKSICHSCAVLQQCRNYASLSQEPHGIWGGVSHRERR
ncbi:WhiB family transcriptional regulator [Prescottella agglutinans]|uniref:WhiB family transcriptional regulator n=1 Tax=Prescottella agglutinans TaxID=1644129 RepID=UPI0024772566|nr:WhiB family transcriptional regulator [Prescottella agglutinans]